MRPPWSEAIPLLASAGFAGGPPPKPETPWSRLMKDQIDYAFLTRVDAVARPVAFPSIEKLAAHIERRRQDRTIILEEIEDIHERRRMAQGDSPSAPRGLRDRGVQIFTLLPDGSRDRSLGFAWLRGGGRERLQDALTRVGIRSGRDPRRAVMA